MKVNKKLSQSIVAAGGLTSVAGVGSVIDPDIPTGTGLGQITLGGICMVQHLNALGIVGDKLTKLFSGLFLTTNLAPAAMGIHSIANGDVTTGLGQISLSAFSSIFCANQLGIIKDKPPKKSDIFIAPECEMV